MDGVAAEPGDVCFDDLPEVGSLEIKTRRWLRRVLLWDGHTARQFRLQPPPLPAPQEPEGAPHGMELAVLECAFTAKVESCCSSFLLLQEGHSG
jgi:hypothetical protein